MVALSIIRSPTTSDADAIVPLLAELGYPATSSEVTSRLDRLATSDNCVVLVAERDSEVVGLITSHMFTSIHSTEPVAWLTTLVIHNQAQGLGIGRELVTAVEKWARENGAVRISLTSGNHRLGAHKFYERCGYESSGVRLTKVL